MSVEADGPDGGFDPWIEQLVLGAATFDELLSDEFESLPGQKADADMAARRLSAWCRAAASGDWSLFARRLERDGLSLQDVLARFATVRCRAGSAPPEWAADAVWILVAMEQGVAGQATTTQTREVPFAFEDLFTGVVQEAEARLFSSIDLRVSGGLAESARDDLRQHLLRQLSDLCAPAFYEGFARERRRTSQRTGGAENSAYRTFVTTMRAGGLRRLGRDKPVLIRLIATVTRQWLQTSRELLIRLDSDRQLLEDDILGAAGRVTRIEGDLSDPHNGGRSVHIVTFEGGARVVYKPKDVRLDLAWHALVTRLNTLNPPVDLRAVQTIARDGYGWAEYIAHTECADREGYQRFFQRSGAWLALFHCFSATDMHQENMIAAEDQPVPIDLEMVMQPNLEVHKTGDPEALAFEAVAEELGNSVLRVGLLPSFTRSPENELLATGGLISRWTPSKPLVTWLCPNSDAMRPRKGTRIVADSTPNLPHIDGCSPNLRDYFDDFIGGFRDYATFLLDMINANQAGVAGLLEGFDDIVIRRIVHITRFYYLLLQRLTDHRRMDDGVVWSVQADFPARLANWDLEEDPLWALQRAQRNALLSLNVPYFASAGDSNDICDSSGILAATGASPGISRARARMRSLGLHDITWQSEIIRESLAYASRAVDSESAVSEPWFEADQIVSDPALWRDEAGAIAAELASVAVRRGKAAAWIGLDWLGDSDVSQFVLLGPDLYNGESGIAVFLAAHAGVTGDGSSAELALAGVAHLRKSLMSRNGARFARSLGPGAVTGLGSIVYGLAVMSQCLDDPALLDDAQLAAGLFTDDLIAADTLLDVVGGSAGAILSLLRLYRDTRSEQVLARATKCGEHLLSATRIGNVGARTWRVPGLGPRPLTGLSHGAAGFSYAMSSLSAATGREDFAAAAVECLAFEDDAYSRQRSNWPDLRGEGEPQWGCQWCHGAAGIGLARIGMIKHGANTVTDVNISAVESDIHNAVGAVLRSDAGYLDTLCCGTLGGIELLRHAGTVLGRHDLSELATRRLRNVVVAASGRGDYRWNGGSRRFNLGLFRGLAGIGYTLLREIDVSLPNVLIFD